MSKKYTQFNHLIRNSLIKIINSFLKSSFLLKTTLFCLICFLIIIFWGTLSQVHLGIYLTQKKFFQSFFIFWEIIPDFNIPIFPGGTLIGIILFINLFTVIFINKLYTLKKLGLLTIHLGVMTFLLGGGLTSFLGIESQLSIEEGETKNYSEDIRKIELAIIDRANPDYDQVISIPQSILKKQNVISHPQIPFELIIKSYLPNAKLTTNSSNKTQVNLPHVTKGIGTEIYVNPNSVFTQDNLVNLVTVFVEIVSQGTSLGTWLLSRAIENPQTVVFHNNEFDLILRPVRYYTPYSLTLKDFNHDIYPGTDIPKNFSSLVHLNDQEKQEMRDVLIYMNHPLRYRGKTYYQASFGKNDTLSILQVVQNPAWLFPYLACFLVTAGLIFQFLSYLIRFSKKNSR